MNHNKTAQDYDVQYSVHLRVCKRFGHSLQTYDTASQVHDEVKVSGNTAYTEHKITVITHF